MTLLAPAWLWLLLPWAGVCLWSITRNKTTAGVPFLTLWPKVTPASGTRRGRPPVWMICLLAAALLTIFAAAGPARVRDASAVTILVDRSAALTPARLKAAEESLQLPARTLRRVVPVPGQAFESGGAVDWSRVRPTAIASDQNLAQIAATLPGPVVVMTDRHLDLPADIPVIHPPTIHNAGIAKFGVTALPATVKNASGEAVVAQAMVSLINNTPQQRAMLRVDQVNFPIELPIGGQIRDFFVDLPVVGAVCEAKLLTADGRPWEDDVMGDDTAFLVRGGLPAKIDLREGQAEDLRRMAMVYERHRGSPADSPRVSVVRGEASNDLTSNELAVLVSGSISPGDNGELTIDAGHPVTHSADFSGVRYAGRSTKPPPGDGWRVLVRTAGDVPVLAVREKPVRQVWVGFDSSVLADRADYVVFWTDVFDWLAGAGGYSAEPVRDGLSPVRVADVNLEASPGVYRDGTRMIATYLSADVPATLSAAVPTERTADEPRVKPQTIRQTEPLAAWPLAAAMTLLAIGLSLYRSLTRF